MEFLIKIFEVDQSDFLYQTRIRLSHDLFSYAKMDQKFERLGKTINFYGKQLFLQK